MTPVMFPPEVFSALFVGFTATMAESDFSCPCIIGYGSSPSRCGPSLALDADGQSRDIPSSNAILLRVMWPLDPGGGEDARDQTRPQRRGSIGRRERILGPLADLLPLRQLACSFHRFRAIGRRPYSRN